MLFKLELTEDQLNVIVDALKTIVSDYDCGPNYDAAREKALLQEIAEQHEFWKEGL